MQSSASRLVAPALLQVKVERTEVEPLVPPGLWWFYIIGPPLIAALVTPEFLMRDLETAIRGLIVMYIHCAAIAGPLHFAYARVLPRVFDRLGDRFLIRGLLHFATVALIVPAATFSVIPLITPICPAPPMDAREGLLEGYVISALMLLAAVTYQRVKKRAQAVERMAVAERHAALAAQLRALQSRTNPHFLFNSLNAVASLIPKDPARAEQTVERLAEVLRYSLQRTRRGLVKLEEELDVIAEYLEIEAVRFGDRLTYRIDVDPRTKRFRIPPMSLEPLVENAVLHGIGTMREGGTIHIEAKMEGEQLLLSVTDDGPGCGASSHRGTGTGLEDLRERLLLLYGRDDVLTLESGPQGGCRATLTIPISK